MPLVPQGDFTFKHVNQTDTPSVSASTLKGQWDTQANELKTTLNNLITALEKTTVTSGAQQIGSLAIADITGTSIHAQLLSLRDKLKSVVDGSSGADFVGSTAIAGVTGATVQSQLESIKLLIDAIYTKAQLDAGQLDNRYFTETELQSTTDSSAGADKIGATAVSGLTGATVQALLESLKTTIDNVVLGVIPDASSTDVKLSNDAGQIKDRLTAHETKSAFVAHGTIPACRVKSTVSLSIPTGVNTAIAFNSEKYDTSNIHNDSTNNTRLTVPETGIYLMIGSVGYAGNATGRRELSIRVSGITTISDVAIVNLNTTSPLLSVSAMYSLVLGDYVELMTFQDSGGALLINTLNDYSPHFEIVRVG